MAEVTSEVGSLASGATVAFASSEAAVTSVSAAVVSSEAAVVVSPLSLFPPQAANANAIARTRSRATSFFIGKNSFQILIRRSSCAP